MSDERKDHPMTQPPVTVKRISDERLKELVERFRLRMEKRGSESVYSLNTDGLVEMAAMALELIAARETIATHDLCHNLHGKVDARAFADGCTAEQRKLYGCAPDADELSELRATVATYEALLREAYTYLPYVPSLLDRINAALSASGKQAEEKK